jgi:GNAT superfamily N-acetyltransferase
VSNNPSMDCQEARVEPISQRLPESPLFDAVRKLERLAQEEVYLPFMGRATLDLFQSRSATPSWDEGSVALFFHAYVGTQLVGVSDLMTQRDNWRLVEPMYVLPECQRQGVGRKLWGACKDAAIRHRAKGLRVVALEQNEVATSFYSLTLGLPEVGRETLSVGSRVFPAIRYEIALP